MKKHIETTTKILPCCAAVSDKISEISIFGISKCIYIIMHPIRTEVLQRLSTEFVII